MPDVKLFEPSLLRRKLFSTLNSIRMRDLFNYTFFCSVIVCLKRLKDKDIVGCMKTRVQCCCKTFLVQSASHNFPQNFWKLNLNFNIIFLQMGWCIKKPFSWHVARFGLLFWNLNFGSFRFFLKKLCLIGPRGDAIGE